MFEYWYFELHLDLRRSPWLYCFLLELLLDPPGTSEFDGILVIDISFLYGFTVTIEQFCWTGGRIEEDGLSFYPGCPLPSFTILWLSI